MASSTWHVCRRVVWDEGGDGGLGLGGGGVGGGGWGGGQGGEHVQELLLFLLKCYGHSSERERPCPLSRANTKNSGKIQHTNKNRSGHNFVGDR